MTTLTSVPYNVEYNLYGKPWGKLLTKASMRHPAKFSLNLTRWIYRHGLDLGYWRAGDLILDPFAGVAGGGVIAPEFGLRWLGVELEQKFVDLAWGNIALRSLEPPALILHGDSRNLRQIVAGFLPAGVVTSPPYANRVDDHGTDKPEYDIIEKMGVYGESEGQVGRLFRNMGAVTSPPFTPPDPRDRHPVQAGVISDTINRAYTTDAAAQTPGNIALSDPSDSKPGGGGETYWDACRAVYTEVFHLLPPGGVMAIVVKDFVKDKKRVPLCDMTLQLLIDIGFTPLERTAAMLMSVKPDGSITSHKSFFRRLQESKGSPTIDYEEVLWTRRP